MLDADRLARPATDAAARRGSEARADALRTAYGRLDGAPLLRFMIGHEFPGRIALVSSFGAESAVLLDLVAGIDPTTPVLFLDTGKLFPETLAYRDALAARLGLRDVRGIRPDPDDVARADPLGGLWLTDPDACCRLRKVAPLDRALAGFDAWITGRKRYQGGIRGDLAAIEAVDGRIKINPLAAWPQARVEAAFAARDLPRHPLAKAGFPSIGCRPCTRLPTTGAGPRDGRWPGLAKTECGIHGAPAMRYT